MSSGWNHPQPAGWERVIETALAEDLGSGDLSAGCISPDHQAAWFIEAQEEGVVCGIGLATAIFGKCWAPASDGERVEPGTLLVRGESSSVHVLSRERTALNFLMLLSGTASLTAQYVAAVEGTDVAIVDTRKTIPGLRSLQKYAVRCGGGVTHRMGLFDGLMIKENHISAAGSLTEAVAKAHKVKGHMTKIEVEAETLDQAIEAYEAGADIVMLDNMSCDEMSAVSVKLKGKVILEASGGVSLQTVRAIAETGVDAISVGALTHSAPSLSIHLEFE